MRWRPAGAGTKLNTGVTVTASKGSFSVASYGSWVVRLQACNDAGCGPLPGPTVRGIPADLAADRAGGVKPGAHPQRQRAQNRVPRGDRRARRDADDGANHRWRNPQSIPLQRPGRRRADLHFLRSRRPDQHLQRDHQHHCHQRRRHPAEVPAGGQYHAERHQPAPARPVRDGDHHHGRRPRRTDRHGGLQDQYRLGKPAQAHQRLVGRRHGEPGVPPGRAAIAGPGGQPVHRHGHRKRRHPPPTSP